MKKTLVFASLGGLFFAGAANAAYTGLYTEEYTSGYAAPDNSITFRLYATFDNAMDQVTGMGGTAQEPWTMVTEPGITFYNAPSGGGHWAHDAFFDDFVDFLHYDSYWTIGTDDSSAGAPLGIAFPGVQPTWDDTTWLADDGGVYRTPDDPLSFPVDGMVLLGQFTFITAPGAQDVYAYGAVKLNGVSDGEALSLYEEFAVPVPAPGALALLGLAGLVGRRRR